MAGARSRASLAKYDTFHSLREMRNSYNKKTTKDISFDFWLVIPAPKANYIF